MSEFYEKDVALQQETLHDVDLKHATDQDLSHLTSLTEEEKVIEKKLRKKIDLLVMPLVLIVYVEEVGRLENVSKSSMLKMSMQPSRTRSMC